MGYEADPDVKKVTYNNATFSFRANGDISDNDKDTDWVNDRVKIEWLCWMVGTVRDEWILLRANDVIDGNNYCKVAEDDARDGRCKKWCERWCSEIMSGWLHLFHRRPRA